uniref:Uncharacterized protein n=1 Tax=Myripristis murdjan TaxID=586833 RepID=A0A668ABS2_9TELE
MALLCSCPKMGFCLCESCPFLQDFAGGVVLIMWVLVLAIKCLQLQIKHPLISQRLDLDTFTWFCLVHHCNTVCFNPWLITAYMVTDDHGTVY